MSHAVSLSGLDAALLSLETPTTLALWRLPGPLMEGAGVNLTVVSYVDSVDFGVNARDRAEPHVWDVALGSSAAVADLFEIDLAETS